MERSDGAFLGAVEDVRSSGSYSYTDNLASELKSHCAIAGRPCHDAPILKMGHRDETSGEFGHMQYFVKLDTSPGAFEGYIETDSAFGDSLDLCPIGQSHGDWRT